MLFVASNFGEDFLTQIERSFLLIYGSWSPEIGESPAIWAIFVLAVIVNNWMILNFMIAVYGNTFSDVTNNSEVYNYMTKCEMAYEVESIMFWRRNYYVTTDSELGNSIKHQHEFINVKDNLLYKISTLDSETIKEKKLKGYKEYIHVCKLQEEPKKVNQEQERVIAMYNQSKKILKIASDVSKKVSSVHSEGEKVLKDLKFISKKSSESEEKKKIEKKKELKNATFEILNKMLALLSTHEMRKRDKLEKEISKKIKIILESS
jgi:hypothetical protein